MSFLKSLGAAIAGIFTGPVDPTPVKREEWEWKGDISEPVKMMLASIAENPRAWRVKVTLPEYDHVQREFKRVSSQIRGHGSRENIVVYVSVTDTNTGEKFEGSIWADSNSVYQAIIHKAMHRISDMGMLFPTGVSYYPSWMTHDEANAVAEALFLFYRLRLDRVLKYLSRAYDRREALATIQREAAKKAERQRLIQVYSGVQK